MRKQKNNNSKGHRTKLFTMIALCMGLLLPLILIIMLALSSRSQGRCVPCHCDSTCRPDQQRGEGRGSISMDYPGLIEYKRVLS